MMLKDGTEDGTGEVEDGTAKTGVVKNQDGRCLLRTTNRIRQTWPPCFGALGLNPFYQKRIFRPTENDSF